MTKGFLLVLSGPSGVGKTTIAHALKNRLEGVFSVSATTRPPSKHEKDGVDYIFLSNDAFQEMIAKKSFLEHAKVYGKHYYGTLKDPVQKSLAQGLVVLLDIDVQGALQVKKSISDSRLVFILPPNEKVLLNRLRTRARESEETIQRRFLESKIEIDRAKKSNCYDLFVINEKLDKAIVEIEEFLKN
tara:strand:+ start:254 stop:814 length:561 start_codon:yes stop_codon:yes gene_type:complete